MIDDVLGAIGIASLNIRPADTCLAQGINDLPTIAAPTTILMMEGAVNAALQEYLLNEESTVTLKNSLRMLGFAGVGSDLQANAKCVEVNDDELKFEIEVYCATRLIAQGEIVRKVVDRITLTAKIAAQGLIDHPN